jgi:hypothetical protein
MSFGDYLRSPVPVRGSATTAIGVDGISYEVEKLAKRIHRLVAAISDEQAVRRGNIEKMAIRVIRTGANIMEAAEEDNTPDWTAQDGRSNSSPEFNRLTEEVARLIRDSAHDLIAGRADRVAELIMAQLAHKHGLAPRKEDSG